MADLEHDQRLENSADTLDYKAYKLNKEQLAFFKRQTGIEDEEELKEHILAVRAEAYEVHPYPCIKVFGFTRTHVNRSPIYKHVLELGRERKMLLDIGCCLVGSDIRRIAADGYPMDCIVASDLYEDFWTLGHKLFKSTPETFPVAFVPGDVFDPRMLDVSFTDNTSTRPPLSDLKNLTSLQHLLGRVSVIHASWFFHLFSKDRQVTLAERLGALLSPEPGSVIFGLQMGNTVCGPAYSHWQMYCHSPESWKALWEEEVFEKGAVEVETRLTEVADPDPGLTVGLDERTNLYVLVWSVKRAEKFHAS